MDRTLIIKPAKIDDDDDERAECVGVVHVDFSQDCEGLCLHSDVSDPKHNDIYFLVILLLDDISEWFIIGKSGEMYRIDAEGGQEDHPAAIAVTYSSEEIDTFLMTVMRQQKPIDGGTAAMVIWAVEQYSRKIDKKPKKNKR